VVRTSLSVYPIKNKFKKNKKYSQNMKKKNIYLLRKNIWKLNY
jgi:hypothetical protein